MPRSIGTAALRRANLLMLLMVSSSRLRATRSRWSKAIITEPLAASLGMGGGGREKKKQKQKQKQKKKRKKDKYPQPHAFIALLDRGIDPTERKETHLRSACRGIRKPSEERGGQKRTKIGQKRRYRLPTSRRCSEEAERRPARSLRSPREAKVV